MDSTSIPHLHFSTPAAPTVQQSGVDPALVALMGNRDGGMFGGANGLLPLLIGAFLFGGGRGGGLFGNGNGAAGGDAIAAASISTSKDVMAQLNTFQTWACNNASQLAAGIAGIDKSICCSSAHITAAVNALTPQMYQGFAAQAMAGCQQTAAINANITSGNFAIEKTLDAGFSAGALASCRTDNLVQATGCDVKTQSMMSFSALAQQLAACCCEQRLATCNQNALIERNTAAIQNQLNQQACEIKQAISADGQATRALITSLETDHLRSELVDAKSAIRDAELVAKLSKGNGDK